MEKKSHGKTSFSQKIISRVRHGLILFSIRNFLSRIGIEVLPYWIEREGLDLCLDIPKIKDVIHEYRFLPIEPAFIQKFFEEQDWNSSAWEKNPLWTSFAYALFKNSQIAAFVMVRTGSFEYHGKYFQLADHEAYIENMYTFDAFRGKNLAPYLASRCYQHLAEKGITFCCSITQYFNRSALKYKSKLGARHQELYLHIGLFKRFKRTFLLRRYPDIGK